MSYLDFTAEETNLIAIYVEPTRTATIENIVAVLPDMDDEMRDIAARTAAKLAAMTDDDFKFAAFVSTDEDDDPDGTA